MSKRICCALLLVFSALSAFAGSGTIKETDTEIIIEYSGDEEDKKVTSAVKEEQQQEAAKEEKALEMRKAKIDKSERNAERRKNEDAEGK